MRQQDPRRLVHRRFPRKVRCPSRARLEIICGLLHRRSTCFWCGEILTEDTATIEHIVPRSWGGSNDPSNLEVACEPCNHRRGNTLVHQMTFPEEREVAHRARLLMKGTGSVNAERLLAYCRAHRVKVGIGAVTEILRRMEERNEPWIGRFGESLGDLLRDAGM